MDDERIVKLLEEIRDLQKLNVESYREALKNQQESIALQKKAVRRSRISLITLIVMLAAFMVVLIYFPKS